MVVADRAGRVTHRAARRPPGVGAGPSPARIGSMIQPFLIGAMGALAVVSSMPLFRITDKNVGSPSAEMDSDSLPSPVEDDEPPVPMRLTSLPTTDGGKAVPGAQGRLLVERSTPRSCASMSLLVHWRSPVRRFGWINWERRASAATISSPQPVQPHAPPMYI